MCVCVYVCVCSYIDIYVFISISLYIYPTILYKLDVMQGHFQAELNGINSEFSFF